MKKYAMLFMFFIGLLSVSFAQEGIQTEDNGVSTEQTRGGKMRKGKRGKAMKRKGKELKKELNLSDEQAAQIKEIRKTAKGEEKEIKGQYKTEIDEQKQARKALRAEFKDKSPEERKAAMSAHAEQSKAKMEPMHQQLKVVRENADSKIKAILTPEQQTKFEEIKAKQKEMRKGKRKGGKRERKERRNKE